MSASLATYLFVRGRCYEIREMSIRRRDSVLVYDVLTYDGERKRFVAESHTARCVYVPQMLREVDASDEEKSDDDDSGHDPAA